MAEVELRGYAKGIVAATGCKPEEAAAVEDIMRNDVFHSTLDWQSRRVFDRGARAAYEVYREIEAMKARGEWLALPEGEARS